MAANAAMAAEAGCCGAAAGAVAAAESRGRARDGRRAEEVVVPAAGDAELV